jgi:hypothetical protein
MRPASRSAKAPSHPELRQTCAPSLKRELSPPPWSARRLQRRAPRTCAPGRGPAAPAIAPSFTKSVAHRSSGGCGIGGCARVCAASFRRGLAQRGCARPRLIPWEVTRRQRLEREHPISDVAPSSSSPAMGAPRRKQIGRRSRSARVIPVSPTPATENRCSARPQGVPGVRQRDGVGVAVVSST